MHDGLGSQLSTILSSLGRNTPQERATAAALHECLLELKLLVDGADETVSVVQLLASLRYRLQPLLQASGIELHWHVAFAQELEQFDGARAREVLRIAQEALGNVVRHSGASQVRLRLRHVQPAQTLELEINDNGKGLASALERDAHHAMGRGPGGMRQRAAALGGQLSICSAPGARNPVESVGSSGPQRWPACSDPEHGLSRRAHAAMVARRRRTAVRTPGASRVGDVCHAAAQCAF